MDQVKMQHTSIRSLFFGSALFLLFSLITLLSPKSAMAQGTQCLGAWFDFKSVTVNSVSGLDSRITTTTNNIPVEITITPSKSSDITYWADLSARKYSLEATRSDRSVASVSPVARNQNSSGQLVLLFNLPGSEFTKLANDQQTGYAVNLKVPYRNHCLVASYTATRPDNQPPPKVCGSATRGQCAAVAGCGANEVCIDEGVNFVCKKLPGSCGYKTCGGVGNPANGDVCNCAGTTFTPMTGTNNSCCGWVVNGSCQATAPVTYAECGTPVTHGANTLCEIPASDGTYKYLFISGPTSPEAYQCSAEPNKCCTRVSSCQKLTNTCGRTRMINGQTRCVVGANNFELGEVSGLTMCTDDNRFCCTDSTSCTREIANNPRKCGDPGTQDKCAGAGGCTTPDQVCQNGSCQKVAGKCGVPDSLVPPPTPEDEANPKTGPSDQGSLLDAVKGPTNKTFDALNPLNIAAGLKGEPAKSPYFRTFSTPGGIISRALLFAFPIAGIILFLMIVWGGFEMVTGATNAKSMDAGKQRITAAVIGFGLLFVSYWLMQIVELVFGLSIL